MPDTTEIEKMRSQEMEEAMKMVSEASPAAEEIPPAQKEEKVAEAAAQNAEVPAAKEEKSFLEILNTASTESAPVKTVAEVQTELEKILKEKEDLSKQLNSFKESEVAKIIESGLTIEQIAKGIKITDYSNHSIEHLIELELKSTGKNAEEIEADLKLELDHYSTLTPLSKSQYEASLREKYKGGIEYSEATALLKEALDKKAQENANKQTPEQFEKIQQQIQQKDISDIDTILNSLKSQGYQVSDEMVKGIKGRYNYHMAEAYATQDGGFNTKGFISDSYILLNHKTAIDEAYQKGLKEGEKKYGHPDMSNRGGGGVPGQRSVDEQLNESENKRFNNN